MALKAAPADQALLLDLQALDTKLDQLDHRARSLPQLVVLAGIAAELSVARQSALESTGAREDVSAELKRLESDVEVVAARIKRDTDRLEASSSQKDIVALEQELTALRKRRDDLEEIELTVMERLEEVESTAAERIAAVDAIIAKQGTVETERDELLIEIKNERTHTAANRSTIESQIPAELLALYTKQRTRYGYGASLLQHGVSTAVGVKFLESEMQAIRALAPDDVYICPQSDAILVRTNESGI